MDGFPDIVIIFNILIAGLCCSHGRVELLQCLLARGGHCSGAGLMLLAGAEEEVSEERLVECAEVLMTDDQENNVNQTHSQGWTPLMMSARKGRNSLVTFLLSHGAKINETDDIG